MVIEKILLTKEGILICCVWFTFTDLRGWKGPFTKTFKEEILTKEI